RLAFSVFKRIALWATFFMGIYISYPLVKHSVVSKLIQNVFLSYGFEGVLIEGVQSTFGSVILKGVHVPSSSQALEKQGNEDAIYIKNVKCVFTVMDLLFERSFKECTLEEGVFHVLVNSESIAPCLQTEDALQGKDLGFGFKKLGFENCQIIISTPFTASTTYPFFGSAEKNLLSISYKDSNTSHEGTLVIRKTEKETIVNLDAPSVMIDLGLFSIKSGAVSFKGSYDLNTKAIDLLCKIRAISYQDGVLGTVKMPLDLSLTGQGNFYTLDLDIIALQGRTPVFKAQGELSAYYKKLSAVYEMTIQELYDFFSQKDAFITDLKGHLTLKGKISLEHNVDSKCELHALLKEIDFIIPSSHLQVKGLQTGLFFNTLAPLHAQDIQTVFYKSVKTPLLETTNGQFSFVMNPWTKGLNILDSTGQVLDGTFNLHNVRWNEETQNYELDVNLKKIALGKFLELSQIKHLKGKGTMMGEAIMTYDLNKGLRVKTLYLSSFEEGILSYTPPKAQGSSSPFEENVPLQALEDFHYTLLSLGVSSEKPKNDLQAKIHLIGHNPKVMNGYPFEVEFTTINPLEDLGAQALLNFKMPQKNQN
ncbi:MAG TPA: YdbH domain-containing protein, partial [Alphaproteobacteria bacterium]|nr:YdbH domain-containing protein [Alphaproteobacteria bacterium]